VEGTVAKLLEGKYKMYIRCINVDYESSRLEPFYGTAPTLRRHPQTVRAVPLTARLLRDACCRNADIQLNVKGLKTLEDSFKDYIQVETMDGDNKYMAEGYGLQDARKGVIFEKLPPVLHLQLKRYASLQRRNRYRQTVAESQRITKILCRSGGCIGSSTTSNATATSRLMTGTSSRSQSIYGPI